MQSKQVYYISQLVRAHCEMCHWYVIMWITAIFLDGWISSLTSAYNNCRHG